ncbi:nucleosidase [Candidatus Scalindua japonica]|uniref:adenosylhomocysteine nucleosidase n=1 Tax=Candidatus Scalindua japonica TaxID=1284222 RepID=A0A286TUP0_9BACT|nr:5'-methylthioadenosine/S-adenosylhomocysteine nucleosidase [Candidatus Scalindua japonica]GAX59607.1 nucleosidase [Candidatus Scalindua japonica]
MIAVLCAIRQEASPLIACMNVSRKFDIDKIPFYQGELNGLPLILVQGGIGSENATKATSCLLESTKVDLLISAGVAGGIRDGLNVGDIVIAEGIGYTKQDNFSGEVLHLKSKYECSKEVVQLARQYCIDSESKLHFGALLTVDKVIGQASTKRRIGEHNSFLAVEMESAAIAKVASEKGVEFAAIRSISDDIEDELQLDYDNILSDEGKVKVSSIALGVMRHPQRLALLRRLNKQTKSASKSLANFLSELIPLIDTSITNRL